MRRASSGSSAKAAVAGCGRKRTARNPSTGLTAAAQGWGDGICRRVDLHVSSGAGVAQREGLLHDARNLMSALGLYCDLLSVPGVLKTEHLHYAEELRLVATRSGALMEHMTLSTPGAWGESESHGGDASTKDAGCGVDGPDAAPCIEPVGLRSIVERCSGLLSRVAGGRTIEVSYGAAASMPVLVAEEAVERILVNLVRNAAAALDQCGDDTQEDAVARHVRGTVEERMPDSTADETPGSIRIGVGLLMNRVGDPQPWPFRRVRLTVEDSGCGMGPEQLERMTRRGRKPGRGNHGIGFCVVQELVAAADGDLRLMSSQGVGTRVQIEWPLAADGGANGGPGGNGEQRGGLAGVAGLPDPLEASRAIEPVAESTQLEFGDGRWTV